jgi:predicted TIM-barrel enzyme
LADAILVSGPMAGEEPPLESILEAKQAVPDVPVFLNTGARDDNIEKVLAVADGVIVGSSLKQHGYTWNRVDPERVAAFMGRVRSARARAETNADG